MSEIFEDVLKYYKNNDKLEKVTKQMGFAVRPSTKERFDKLASRLNMSKVALFKMAIDVIERSLDENDA